MSNDEEYMKVVFFFTQLQEAAFVINDKLSFNDRYVAFQKYNTFYAQNEIIRISIDLYRNYQKFIKSLLKSILIHNEKSFNSTF